MYCAGAMITAFGAGMDSDFDETKLRYHKIICMTDADVDGFQIRTLILTMLYRLVPTLIREGYVYIAESPLYEIECKGKTYFAYSDREKAEIADKLGNAKLSISRSKGLGENGGDVDCGSVGGNVTAAGDVDCGGVAGNVYKG